MKKAVFEVIERIYTEKKYGIFKKKCISNFNFSNEIIKIAKRFSENVIEENLELSPSLTWHIEYVPFKSGELKVAYKTIISISKIVPIFYVQHEFEVENVDPNRMTPILDGYGSEAYSKLQLELHQAISKLLCDNGFEELSYLEMNEVVLNIEMPKDITIFGSQMTVEACLFRDLFGICEMEV